MRHQHGQYYSVLIGICEKVASQAGQRVHVTDNSSIAYMLIIFGKDVQTPFCVLD